MYHREFIRLNQFERIDIGLEKFLFMTMLLESTLLPNLTYLCINFDQIHVDSNFLKATVLKVHPVVKTLIKNLNSAPSLDYLEFHNAMLDLDDMEELHTGAAKLKVIDAHCTSISNEFIKTVPTSADKKSIIDSSGVVIVRETESTVEKNSIDFFVLCSAGIYDINGELKNTLIKWLLYMGCKYRSTEIIFKQSSAYLPEICEFENPILTIISKMSDTKKYHASLYPITKSIMNAMDEKKGRLEHLYLYTNTMESIEAQLQHAGVPKQAKTICYLNIKSGNLDLKNSITLQSILSGLSQRFCSLINSKIKCTMHHCALIELFQMLPSLLEVFVDSICFDATENIIMIPITRTKVQSLSLIISSATAPNMLQANQVMEFILQSCPLLSTFTLSGSVFEIAILKLCFFYHQKLTKITINVKKVQYYTFSWENEKQGLQWADCDEIAESNDITGRKPHIDIAWRGKNVILDLQFVY
ncbi:hypothetical protein INT47_006891 [Mucor saturninus]|uniref:Uncharacterized protein n=1 Tax=Mucor saturninus TaxID=64648 RepID=A0A8H7RA76_9FUNG|nr:hypothetical protein INT47_006891 [Mucor saturninus]